MWIKKGGVFMKKVVVKWAKICPYAIIPKAAYNGDAGVDLATIEEYLILPGERKLVRTGLKVEIPYGYELQIRPRSGLSLKSPLIIANSPGTIDCNYRGEIMVIIWNTGMDAYKIYPGMKIAQAVLQKLPVVEHIEVPESELSDTQRAEKGFGSSGI